jgi:hypothetical protein
VTRYRRSGGWTGRQLLIVLAVLLMGSSGAFWWEIQHQLTGDMVMAAVYMLILTAAPPVLTSFLIPWSPAGMLLQRINARTIGYAVVIAIAIFLFYYSYTIQVEWWASQPQAAGLVLLQALVGLIGFILVPALSLPPVTGEELMAQVEQAHLVKKYELQTQGDIAILRAALLHAHNYAERGFANLSAAERRELAAISRGLVMGIDATLKEIGESVNAVAGARVAPRSLTDDPEIAGYLDQVDAVLVGAPVAAATSAADAPPARTIMERARQRREGGDHAGS